MKNILSGLLIVGLCTSLVACSSGDYNATPGSVGTSTNNATNNGNNNTTHTGTATGTMSAVINGAAWSTNSVILDSLSLLAQLNIVGSTGSGTNITSMALQISGYSGTGTYISSNSLTQVLLVVGGNQVVLTSDTITILSNDHLGHFTGTFSGATSTNSSYLSSGTFDIHSQVKW